MDLLAQKYIQLNKSSGKFQIKTEIHPGGLKLRIIGISAHSSEPKHGVNPVARALNFLEFTGHEIKFKENHYTDALKFAKENIGLDYYGKKLGVDYRDDFMGPLTASLTWLAHNDGVLEVGVNLRAPRGKSAKQLEREIRKKLIHFKKASGIPFNLTISLKDAYYRDPRGPAIAEMLDIFEGVTGKKGRPLSSAGGTTARELPGGINFGPSMPGEKYRGHNANEFKKMENFMLDVQMFTEMLLRLGNAKVLK